MTEDADTGIADTTRWLVLLMPREEGRIPARAIRAAEADLDHVRCSVENLIDGPRWLALTQLQAIYVALHPTKGNPVPDRKYQRHGENEFINVHFDWTAFSNLPSADRQWWLLDVVLAALRSPATTKRLGAPPLRQAPAALDAETTAPRPAPRPAAPAHEGDRSLNTMLAGMSEHDLLVLRPFPADAPPGANLELIERYDRELEELLTPDATWTVIDSEINTTFLRWVVGPACEDDQQ